MKKLILIALACAFLAGCWPTDQGRDATVEKSFRCMWIGDCQ